VVAAEVGEGRQQTVLVVRHEAAPGRPLIALARTVRLGRQGVCLILDSTRAAPGAPVGEAATLAAALAVALARATKRHLDAGRSSASMMERAVAERKSHRQRR
jgi:hypothetical protein